MFRNDLYMHQRDCIRFALFLMTLDSRVRAQGGARGQDLGHLILFIFLSHLLIAGCDIGVQISVRLFVRAFVCPSVNIYVEVWFSRHQR